MFTESLKPNSDEVLSKAQLQTLMHARLHTKEGLSEKDY